MTTDTQPAASTEPATSALSRQWLICQVTGEEYLLEVVLIREIIRVPEMTTVPRAPQWLRGICSLRGMVIPVIDIGGRLGLGIRPVTPKSRVVVLSTAQGLGGLLVDGVRGMLELEPSRVNPPPPLLAAPHRDLLRGIVHDRDHAFILLNLERAMTLARAAGAAAC
jgi:purine-binding chemotaxis protein CheW